MTTSLTTLKPRADPGPSTLPYGLEQSLRTDFHQNTFAFESSLQASAKLRLTSDWQLCPAHLSHLRNPSEVPECPNGLRCPLRHAAPGPLNFPRIPARDPHRRTVCKHWLRGLCKKGEGCDYLHEYDLRRMPECRFFATFGFCNSGDECLYLHADARSKIRECERYNRGFCQLGPACPKRHVRRPACPHYLAGFCPKGPDCRLGHPKTNPPSAASRSSSPIITHKPMTAEEAFGPSAHARERMERGEIPSSYRPRGANDAGAEGGGRFNPYGDRGGANGAGGRRYDGNQGAPGPDRGAGGGAGGRGPRKDLSEVLCFKCGEYGHFANNCPNPNRPGNRGGLDRRGGGPGGPGAPGAGGGYGQR